MKKAGLAKKERADGQISGLAGELFVAAELLKRGLQTSVTFGNAKQIDLFAHNSQTGRNFNIQVKALRAKNYFPITHAKVKAEHVYVFVLLNRPGEAVQYFISTGRSSGRASGAVREGLSASNISGHTPKFAGRF